MDFEKITQKFYATEVDRLKKIRENAQLIEIFGKKMEDVILLLTRKKIRLWIFEANENTNPPCLYAGLTACCGKIEPTTDDDRKWVESEIVQRTQFKKITWEI